MVNQFELRELAEKTIKELTEERHFTDIETKALILDRYQMYLEVKKSEILASKEKKALTPDEESDLVSVENTMESIKEEISGLLKEYNDHGSNLNPDEKIAVVYDKLLTKLEDEFVSLPSDEAGFGEMKERKESLASEIIIYQVRIEEMLNKIQERQKSQSASESGEDE